MPDESEWEAVPHRLKKGRPMPVEEQRPKKIWFYGYHDRFEELVAERFGLMVTHPTTGHTASIVEIPTLDEFYAVRRLYKEELHLQGAITDEWQDWILDEDEEQT